MRRDRSARVPIDAAESRTPLRGKPADSPHGIATAEKIGKFAMDGACTWRICERGIISGTASVPGHALHCSDQMAATAFEREFLKWRKAILA